MLVGEQSDNMEKRIGGQKPYWILGFSSRYWACWAFLKGEIINKYNFVKQW